MENKYCFVIVGPTAVGKTYFAIQLAKHFNTSIISADSRQCYKELNIGVAKPSHHDLEAIKHYFINTHSIHEHVTAKVFEAYAEAASGSIFKHNDIAVVVGGTGLYINAFCNGLDEIPVINKHIKQMIISSFESRGIEWLQTEIEREDPAYFKNGEIKNPQRLMRALEVKLSTGKSITAYQQHKKKQNPFEIIKIGLQLPKEQLHRNIHNRTDEMMQNGLLDEARGLLPYKHFNALNTVGYRELFEYFKGESSLEESIVKIKLHTRHYAKRQLTWFKKDKTIQWLNADTDSSAFINICSKALAFPAGKAKNKPGSDLKSDR